jgi:hypothetical protein
MTDKPAGRLQQAGAQEQIMAMRNAPAATSAGARTAPGGAAGPRATEPGVARQRADPGRRRAGGHHLGAEPGRSHPRDLGFAACWPSPRAAAQERALIGGNTGRGSLFVPALAAPHGGRAVMPLPSGHHTSTNQPDGYFLLYEEITGRPFSRQLESDQGPRFTGLMALAFPGHYRVGNGHCMMALASRPDPVAESFHRGVCRKCLRRFFRRRDPWNAP